MFLVTKLVKHEILIRCLQVLSQLLRKAKQRNLVIPNVKQAGSEQGTYEGATVSSLLSWNCGCCWMPLLCWLYWQRTLYAYQGICPLYSLSKYSVMSCTTNRLLTWRCRKFYIYLLLSFWEYICKWIALFICKIWIMIVIRVFKDVRCSQMVNPLYFFGS